MTVRLGVPSKGRMADDAAQWLAAAGLDYERDRSGRSYGTRVRGGGQFEIVLLSAAEIPRELAAGRIDLGVTGVDLVRERFSRWESVVAEAVRMGFGHADLVVAVPDAWVDVETVGDLDAVAGVFRERHGFRLRIATKYHRLVREFLRRRGVADYQLVDSAGATEGTVRNETAEAVADITSTGETLRANHLRPLEDGLVLRSEATLFRSLAADLSAEDEDAVAGLLAGAGAISPKHDP